MRAIGLGGLFRRSTASTAKTSGSTLNSNGSFRVITLEQFEKMTTVDSGAAFEARRSSRFSSINERPQFLFFCGSDTSSPSGEMASPSGSTLASRLASMNIPPTPAQPAIDHHMPVFFSGVGAGFAGC